MKKYIFFLTTLLSSPAFALFCPNSFNQMNFGDSIIQVTAECGAPTAQKTYKRVENNMPQEWTYYVKLDPSQTASVKMIVAIDAAQKVSNITVNAQSLASTSLCGGPISVGQTADMIKKACGSPGFINQSMPQTGQRATTETDVTEYQYGSTTLIFENGKLKSRKP